MRNNHSFRVGKANQRDIINKCTTNYIPPKHDIYCEKCGQIGIPFDTMINHFSAEQNKMVWIHYQCPIINNET